MTRQFNRQYSLTFIGQTESITVSELRITFDVTKSMRSYPNLAQINVYNLGQETINFVTSRNPLINLKVGYEDNIRLIFRGRIRNVFINKVGVDRVLTIYAADGDREWQQASYNKTLNSNVTIKDTVLDIFNTLISDDVSIGTIEGVSTVANKLLGQSLSGSSKDILDGLADEHGFQWSIQDGELTTVGLDAPLTSRTAVVVSQATGMVGSPVITEIGADVTTLLNPELLPNRAFRIESDSQDIALSNLQFREIKRTVAAGLYRAYEVLFTGDNRGSNWYSKVKGTFVNV